MQQCIGSAWSADVGPVCSAHLRPDNRATTAPWCKRLAKRSADEGIAQAGRGDGRTEGGVRYADAVKGNHHERYQEGRFRLGREMRADLRLFREATLRMPCEQRAGPKVRPSL